MQPTVKSIIKLLDFTVSAIAFSLFLALALLASVSRFFKKPPHAKNGIIQLYISIVDFRKSVVSGIREDILLDGFIKKCFSYHFDFDGEPDASGDIGSGVFVNNVNVYPRGALRACGFRKTAALIVVIKSFFSMLDVVRTERVNVIRAQDAHLLGFLAYLLSRFSGAPFIVQICSNYELKDRGAKGLAFRPFLFPSVERFFERALMRRSDMILTDRKHYREFGVIPGDIPEEKYVNMGFFVDKSHYAGPETGKSLHREFGIKNGTQIVLYAGRLSPVKYPVDLVRMFAKVVSERPDTVLVIAGEGTLEKDMRELAHERGFCEKIKFLGRVSHDKMRDLYLASDVAAFTSAGFTLIEAALAGKAVVAYDFEWHGEFIGKNERGLLVPFGDYEKFAESVLQVLEDESLRKSLGKAAREYALAHYGREEAVAKEKELYSRLLGHQVTGSQGHRFRRINHGFPLSRE